MFEQNFFNKSLVKDNTKFSIIGRFQGNVRRDNIYQLGDKSVITGEKIW